ncbi:HAD-IC family P-type ATPase [Streptomyces kaempferi]
MVTGDHPLTAEAVARRVGIVRGPSPSVVTGAQLDALNDDGVDALLAGSAELLLCRVGPEHKMRVVTAFQRLGEVVAVTGDGANDAPALKHADIGVAMGASGTDVAREAAVMVLLDDSFASITAAVGLGRSVYRNIRKFLIYLFSHNIAELVPILAATFAGFPLVPITAVQILAIDLGSDVLPALALGAEPAEADVMDSPRVRAGNDSSPLLSWAESCSSAVSRPSACVPSSSGTSTPPASRTAPSPRMTPYTGRRSPWSRPSIVVSQFFNALAVRTDRQSVFRAGLLTNPWLLAAGGFGIALMAAISYTPPLQTVFNTAPLAAADWAVLAAFGALLLAAEEARKWVVRRHGVRSKGGRR